MNAKKKTVLIVDDNPTVAAAVEHHLLIAGYDVASAESGESALEWLQDEVADLVLLDLVMPGMSGLEVCRRIREHPRAGSVPVVFLTAKKGVRDMSEAHRAGSDLYLTKPFLPGRLLRMVELFLAEVPLARKQMAPSATP